MALLEWKTINSNIEINDTRKKFFNQYFCSLKYRCPGGRIVLNPNITIQDIDAAVKAKNEFERSYHYNYAGSWRSTETRYVDIDAKKLYVLKQIITDYKGLIKLRVENPYVTLYSLNETTLLEITKKYLGKWHQDLKTLYTPKNLQEKEVLEKGNIIVKNPIDYQYKFFCKSGPCYNKNAVAAYLYNLGDLVKVSGSVWSLLEDTTHNHVWNIWFYSNDVDIAEMLNIIEPNFVTNIHELSMGG